jgi:hypothetical protein
MIDLARRGQPVSNAKTPEELFRWRALAPCCKSFYNGCLAMILFFKQVADLPPSMKTHWNVIEERAVYLKNESPD